MQCPKCQGEVAENQRFCEECGTQIHAPSPVEAPICHCPAGTVAPGANGFCENCGFKVNLLAQPFGAIKFDYAPDLGLVSDRGRHHPVNQDAGIVGRSLSGSVALVVADGVSSSDKADVASATAVAAAYK
ncbi:MAG TPA: hypothetical protein VK832_08085, partial [Burkholderiaceae bacterium]|nr:hypothetical protein [Burkholderiaceae bacterium]